MRFKLVEGESINIRDSEAFKHKANTTLDFQTEPNVTGVVVFNSKQQVLPHISNWLTEKLMSGLTPPGTVKTYAKNFSYLLDYLEQHRTLKHQKLDDALLYIQQHTFKEYFQHLRSEKGLASTTVSNRDATYQAFFEEFLCVARHNGKALRDDNPYEGGLIFGSPKSKLVEMCSLDELTALLMCTPHESEKVLVQFIYDSGLRRTEVTKVKKEHIDNALNSERHKIIVDEDTVSIPSEYKAVYVEGSKGRRREIKERMTLTSIHTLGRLKRYFANPRYRVTAKKHSLDAPAFFNTHGNPYTPGSVGKLLERLSQRAKKKGLIKRHIHPHMLRHGFAGSVLRSPDLGNHSVDKLVIVQHCLGHSSLKTTQIYTRLPYDIYGLVADSNGEILTRSQLMEQLNTKTKTKKVRA
ncbi:tyrosine-type recombinase/integrase [Thalassotalea profundi]|nr:tyrosine-type recombinase/integrase [Thalassotalea profundi]